MEEVVRRASHAAQYDCPILIQGDSGTGKELLARAIHHASKLAGKRFVAFNCGAIPPTLAESELFGHEKGSFTGATGRRLGHLELAHGGTLFLDEIGEMSPNLQVLLLRALQEGKVSRVGGSEEIPAKARIIAATNKDLIERTHAGEFREDLYYRIAVYVIVIPPLRDRPEDILPIARHLLNKLNDGWGSRPGYVPKELSGAAQKRLRQYDWPGNVRELNAVLVRAAIEWAGAAKIEDQYIEAALQRSSSTAKATAASAIHLPAEGINLDMFLKSTERAYLQTALDRSGGNQAEAARLLRLKRQTMFNRLKAHKLSRGLR